MMKVAISQAVDEINTRWAHYLEMNHIPYKLVDFYDSEVVHNLIDCDTILWHFHQGDPKDQLFARQLLYSLQASGKRVFPDFITSWHFDDKVGQKYLLESIGAPIVRTWIFYEKMEAMEWIKKVSFPKVFKLRGGAGSQNVRLVKSRGEAKRLTRRAFGRGFSVYNPYSSLRERIRKFREGQSGLTNVIEGIARFIIPPKFSRYNGRDRGYIYFQEFISGNDHDIRVIVIEDKAFALKRMVRKNDFRASGSGRILYDRGNFSEATISLAFKVAEKLMAQCVALDFVHREDQPLITEISYGFSPQAYDNCPGFWDKNLIWHEGRFNPYGWMIMNLLKESTGRTGISYEQDHNF